MALSDVLNEIKLQRNFYRDRYRKTTKLVFWTVMLLYFLVAGCFYSVLTRPAPTYYASANDGMVIAVTPVK